MKKRGILIVLISVTIQSIYTQNYFDKYKSIQTDIFYGFPIEHDKSLKTAIQGNSYGFSIGYNTVNPTQSEYNYLYTYPQRGYSFIYQNFNSTILGESYGIYRHFTYNLQPKKNTHLKLTTGFGLGYATKAYDAITNNQNFAHGSKFLVSAYVKLNYTAGFHQNRLQLTTGASLLHFSNIAFKNPNLGLNTLSAHLGFNYNLTPVQIPVNKFENRIDETTKNAINYFLLLRGGYNESLIVDSGLYPFYTLSFYGAKKINKYSALTAGADFFNATFLKEHIKYVNQTENKNYNPNRYQRAGVFVGHELAQNNFAFISQVGYAVYSPFNYVSNIYERFGFKYKLSEHFVSEITLKANLFRAEALEIGIGYAF